MKKHKNNFLFYFSLLIILVVLFAVIRLEEASCLINEGFEVFLLYKVLSKGVGYDLKGIFLFGSLLSPLIFLNKFGYRLIQFFLVLYLFTNLILLRYFLTNYQLLGAEILMFSFDEVIFILQTETSRFSWEKFYPFLLFPMLFLGVNSFLKRKMTENKYLSFTFLVYLFFRFGMNLNTKFQNEKSMLIKELIL